LVIVQAQPPLIELFPYNPILFAKALNDLHPALIHPTGNGDQNEPKWIQDGAHLVRPLSPLPSYRQGRQQFRRFRFSDHTGVKLASDSLPSCRRFRPAGTMHGWVLYTQRRLSPLKGAAEGRCR